MRYTTGMDSFPICDFCDTDSSGRGIKWVKPIGGKGICNNCARQLEKIVAEVTPSLEE